MTASSELTTKKEQIKKLLTDFPEWRSSDRLLCCGVWQKELEELNVEIDLKWFFFMYSNSYRLTSADSISRLKRLVQKENPELRGINKDSEEEKCRELFTGELNFPNQ